MLLFVVLPTAAVPIALLVVVGVVLALYPLICVAVGTAGLGYCAWVARAAPLFVPRSPPTKSSPPGRVRRRFTAGQTAWRATCV